MKGVTWNRLIEDAKEALIEEWLAVADLNQESDVHDVDPSNVLCKLRSFLTTFPNSTNIWCGCFQMAQELMHFNGGYDSIDRSESSKWIMLCKEVFWQNNHRKEVIPAALQFASSLPADVIHEQFKYVFSEIVDMFISNPNSIVIQALSLILLNIILQSGFQEGLVLITEDSIVRSDADGITPISCDTLYKLIKSMCDTLAVTLVTTSIGVIDTKISIVSSSMLFLSHVLHLALQDPTGSSATATPRKRSGIMKLLHRASCYLYPIIISVLKNSLCNKIDICLYGAIHILFHVCISHDSGLLTMCTLVMEAGDEDKPTVDSDIRPDFSGILLLCRTILYIVGEKKRDVLLLPSYINQSKSYAKSSWLKLLDDDGNNLSNNGISYYNDLIVIMYRILAAAVGDPNVVAFVFQENIDVNGGHYIRELQHLISKRYEQLVSLREITVGRLERGEEISGCSAADAEADKKFIVIIKQLYENCMDSLNEHNPCIGTSPNPYTVSDISEEAPFETNPKLIPYYSIDVDIGAYVMAQTLTPAGSVHVTPLSGNQSNVQAEEVMSGTPRSINGYMNKLVAAISPLAVHTSPQKSREQSRPSAPSDGVVTPPPNRVDLSPEEEARSEASGSDNFVGALSYGNTAADDDSEYDDTDSQGPVTSLLTHYEALREVPNQHTSEEAEQLKKELQQQNMVIMNLRQDLEHQSAVIYELEEELNNQVQENHRCTSQLKEKVVFRQEDDRQREELELKNEKIAQLRSELEHQSTVVSELKIELSSQTMKNKKLVNQLKDHVAGESKLASSESLVKTLRHALEEQEGVISNLHKEMKKQSQAMALQKEELNRQHLRNEEYEQEKLHAGEEMDAATAELLKEKDLTINLKRNEIDELKRQVENQAAQMVEMEAELECQSKLNMQFSNQKVVMQQESARQMEEIQQHKDVIANLTSQLSTQSSVLQSLRDELAQECCGSEGLREKVNQIESELLKQKSAIESEPTAASVSLSRELQEKYVLIEDLNKTVSQQSAIISELQESLVSQAKLMTKNVKQLEEQEAMLSDSSKQLEQLSAQKADINAIEVELNHKNSTIADLEKKLLEMQRSQHHCEVNQQGSGEEVLQGELDQKAVIIMELNAEIAEQNTTISVLKEELNRQTNQTSKYSRQLKERLSVQEEDVLMKEDLARQSMLNAKLSQLVEEKNMEHKLMGHKLRKYKIEVKRLLKKTADLTDISVASQEQTQVAMHNMQKMNDALAHSMLTIKDVKAAHNALKIESNSKSKEIAELKAVMDRAFQISSEVTHVVEHNLDAIGAMETDLPPVEKKKNKYQVKLGTPVPPVRGMDKFHTPDSAYGPEKSGKDTIPTTPSAVTDTLMAVIIAVMIEVGSGITMNHRDGTMYTSHAKREQAFFDTGVMEPEMEQSWSPVALDVVQEMSVLLTVLYTYIKDIVHSGVAPNHPAYNEHIPCGTLRKYVKSGLIPELVDEKRLKLSDFDIIMKKVCGKQQHLDVEEFSKIVIYSTRRRYCRIQELTILVSTLMDSLHGAVNKIMREKGAKQQSKNRSRKAKSSGNISAHIVSQPISNDRQLKANTLVAEVTAINATNNMSYDGGGQPMLSDLLFSDDSSNDGHETAPLTTPAAAPSPAPVTVLASTAPSIPTECSDPEKAPAVAEHEDEYTNLVSKVSASDLKTVQHMLKVERRALRALYTYCCTSEHASASTDMTSKIDCNPGGVLGGLSRVGAINFLDSVGLLQCVESRISVSSVFRYSISYSSWVEWKNEDGRELADGCLDIKSVGGAACDLDTHLTFTQFLAFLINVAFCCYHTEPCSSDPDGTKNSDTMLSVHVWELFSHMNGISSAESTSAFKLKYNV